jgi:hypothetical protein
MLVTASRPPLLHLTFGSTSANLSQNGGIHLALPLPLLAGKQLATHALPSGHTATKGDVIFLANDTELWGAIVLEAAARLEKPARAAYEQMLSLCREQKMHLQRVWHFVPGINRVTEGLERYRQFNIGRWMAFESFFGKDLRTFMPAASAVGVQGNDLIVFFRAGKLQPVYFENPAQVPAYHYPSDYGPCPPSFARGVILAAGERRLAYLSGTASIEGHRSIGEGDWHTQFRTTLHNMELMFNRMNMPAALRPQATASCKRRDFQVYLRHPEALPLIQEWLFEETSLRPEEVRFLQADICRGELDLEVDGWASAVV